MGKNLPSGAQDGMGDGQFVGGRADIEAGVMQDEILEMHEFAVDPQRGDGVGKILTLEKAVADR